VKLLLQLIIKGAGSNDLVEKERGLRATLFQHDPAPIGVADDEVDDGGVNTLPHDLVQL
jgi:hypothetical protein